MRSSDSHVVDACLLACSDLCKDRRVSTNALEHPAYLTSGILSAPSKRPDMSAGGEKSKKR